MEKLIKAISLMFRMYDRNGDNTQELQEVYFARLNKEDHDKVVAKIMRLIDTSKYRPTIAEILDGMVKTEENIIEEKWQDFLWELKNGNPDFGTSVPWMGRMINALGHDRCWNYTADDLPWLEKSFKEKYPQFANNLISGGEVFESIDEGMKKILLQAKEQPAQIEQPKKEVEWGVDGNGRLELVLKSSESEANEIKTMGFKQFRELNPEVVAEIEPVLKA